MVILVLLTIKYMLLVWIQYCCLTYADSVLSVGHSQWRRVNLNIWAPIFARQSSVCHLLGTMKKNGVAVPQSDSWDFSEIFSSFWQSSNFFTRHFNFTKHVRQDHWKCVSNDRLACLISCCSKGLKICQKNEWRCKQVRTIVGFICSFIAHCCFYRFCLVFMPEREWRHLVDFHHLYHGR